MCLQQICWPWRPTGFQPVWYRSDQKWLKILRLCRFILVPTHRVRIWPYIYKVSQWSFYKKTTDRQFFSRTWAQVTHTITKSSHPNIMLILIYRVINIPPPGTSPILDEWFQEALVNLHKDKAEIHIWYIWRWHQHVAAKKGGGIFDQMPFLDF